MFWECLKKYKIFKLIKIKLHDIVKILFENKTKYFKKIFKINKYL